MPIAKQLFSLTFTPFRDRSPKATPKLQKGGVLVNKLSSSNMHTYVEQALPHLQFVKVCEVLKYCFGQSRQLVVPQVPCDVQS